MKLDAQTWKEYKFRDYMLGNYSRKFLLSTFLPGFLFVFLGGLFAAYELFPERYSIMTHSISKLGNYILNTEGWWGFSLSLFVGCISLMSFTFYIYRKISHLSPKLSNWFRGLYLTSAAGMFLISFIADAEVEAFGSSFQLRLIHFPIATILFTCFIFGSVLFLIIIFRDNNPKKGGTNLVAIKKIMPSLVILGIAVVGSGVTQPWKFVESLLGNELTATLTLALSTSMWEWILFIGFISFYLGIAIALPEQNS